MDKRNGQEGFAVVCYHCREHHRKLDLCLLHITVQLLSVCGMHADAAFTYSMFDKQTAS